MKKLTSKHTDVILQIAFDKFGGYDFVFWGKKKIRSNANE